MRKKHIACIYLVCILSLLGGILLADEVKRDVFDLGYHTGMPGTAGLRDNDLISSSTGILSNIQRYLRLAIDTARRLEISTDSL